MVQIIEILKAGRERRSVEASNPKKDPDAVLKKEKIDEEVAAEYGMSAKELQWLRGVATVLRDRRLELTNMNFAKEIDNNIRELQPNPIHTETVTMLVSLKKKVEIL